MDETIVYLEGEVGWDIIPQEVARSLTQASGPVVVELNSGGGYVTDGVAIVNLIRNYNKGETTAHISYAASMMTQIALACDKVGIYDNGIFMIHNVQGGVYGDHNDQMKQAEMQKRMSTMLAQLYVTKTGKSLAEITKMMDETTFLFGQEAVDAGFADFIIETNQAKNKVAAIATAKELFAKGLEARKEEALSVAMLERSLVACASGCNVTAGATTFKDYPMVDETWDSSAAVQRVRTFMGIEDAPTASYKNAFFWYDSEAPENFGSYKLPFLDVVDGKLVANKKAVDSANGAMSGARGGVKIPEKDRSKVQSHIDKYIKKWDDTQTTSGASPTVITDNKSKTNQGAEMAAKDSLLGKIQAKLGINVDKNDDDTVAELELTLKASHDALEAANAALATKTEAMDALSMKLAEAEKFKAETELRLLEAKQIGVDIGVAIEMMNAASQEEASKIAIKAKESNGGTPQGEGGLNPEVSGLKAYAEKIKGSVKP